MNQKFVDQLEAVAKKIEDRVVYLENNVVQAVGLAAEVKALNSLVEVAKTEIGQGVQPASAPSADVEGLPPRTPAPAPGINKPVEKEAALNDNLLSQKGPGA